MVFLKPNTLKELRKCEICCSSNISSAIGVCAKCLKEKAEMALPIAIKNQSSTRLSLGLVPFPPKGANGIRCNLCVAECVMGDGDMGYCGIRGNKGGRLFSLVGKDEALLDFYLDPHVTNCCNAYFCPAGTGCGYPKYSNTKGPEIGYYNLALFFYGCSFTCMFCQNWTHKLLGKARRVKMKELIDLTLNNERISCWCWFGGSAEPQLPFAIKASKEAYESKRAGRILRICYEWNGDGNPLLVERALETVLESGGNVKFDLKAFNPNIHKALTGMDNKRVLENFEMVYRKFWDKRSAFPVLGATTLLVPNYVDEEEVKNISNFLSSLDPHIPYNLLVFHPDFMMRDLPITPLRQVINCFRVAKRNLKRVNVSNLHLLGYPSQLSSL
ncbi:MAG: radical SAM protein [Nitrososphaerales archaeon]